MRDDQCAEIASALTARLGFAVKPGAAARVHGGSIHEAYRFESARGPLFVKVASPQERSMFDSEAAGLEEIARAHAVRVPRVLEVGQTAGAAYLALEWIELTSSRAAAEARIGEELARQHRVVAHSFGWHRNNTIGRTPQENRWVDDWVCFFRDRRLRYQLDLAEARGHSGRLQERARALLERIGEFFSGYSPAASLLHGDLWGGNWGVDERGAPVIFDPAVYFGDREADLAMTRLFGGFGAEFYAAYESAWPLDAHVSLRVDLYNLYHVLNHANLFDGGYARQAERIVDRLLAAIGS